MPFSTYLPEHMGSIRLTPSGPFVAGAYAELTLTYTAGTFGIDDTGMVKNLVAHDLRHEQAAIRQARRAQLHHGRGQ